jgi:hypothetical protein
MLMSDDQGERLIMQRLFALLTGLALGLLVAAPAMAQDRATFVMKSGERVSADLVDMGAGGITARANGQTRTWPLSEIAVIDFSSSRSYPSSETRRISGNHVLVLKNGSTVVGRLVDVSGNTPRRITFSENGTNRTFTTDQVARLYVAAPGGSSGGTGNESLQPGTGRITVAANRGWVNTGLRVSSGQRVNIRTTGEVRLSDDPNDIATPAGSKRGRYAPNSPLPSSLAGALIGRIGNGRPFGIGDQTSFPAPASGLLYLAVNDDALGDNSGEFGVDVSPGTPRRR